MSNDVVSIFGGKFPSLSKDSDIYKSLQETDDRLAGSGGTFRRLSIKGSKFRLMVGGEQVKVLDSNSIHMVIVQAAAVGRTYYEGTYEPGSTTPPTCWSSDTQVPDEGVPQERRQANRCNDCPQNIKGSGQGDSRACKFSQRLAVALGQDGKIDFDNIYQFQVPATSIFGEAKDGKLPLQSYARFLKAHEVNTATLITDVYFDENSEVPKVFFKPVRPLEEDELGKVVALRERPEVQDVLTMTVSQVDNVPDKAVEKKPAAKKPAQKAAEPEEKPQEKETVNLDAGSDDGVVEEPSKRSSSKPTPAPDSKNLAEVIAQWGEDE